MKIASSSVKYPESVTSVQIDYIIALVPPVLWGIYRFKIQSLSLMLLSACAALAVEFLLDLTIYRKPRVPDIYSVYMGLIFSLTLFSETSAVFAALGGALSVIIFRLIGSKGQCFIFAPFGARVILCAVLPHMLNTPENIACAYLYTNSISAASNYEFILGTVNKSIGSVSALAVIIGALYLLIRRNTNRIGSVSYIACSFLLVFFFPLMEGRGMESALNEIFAGEMLFVFAFVMTDFTWSPRSTLVKILSGASCASLTFLLIRKNMYTDAYYLSVIAVGFIGFILDKLFFTLKYRKFTKKEK